MTKYKRYINLVAYDLDFFKSHNKEKRVWQSEISSIGSSNDLRVAFPYLLVGASEYIGHNSFEKKIINVYTDDPRVKNLIGQ